MKGNYSRKLHNMIIAHWVRKGTQSLQKRIFMWLHQVTSWGDKMNSKGGNIGGNKKISPDVVSVLIRT